MGSKDENRRVAALRFQNAALHRMQSRARGIPFHMRAPGVPPRKTRSGSQDWTDDGEPIVLGICAMDKKARSKPMESIIQRMNSWNDFEVVYFGDETLLHKPVEEWPICNALVAFHSEGFPLEKAEAYVKLRKPFLINDLPSQHILHDRRKVYALLQACNIDVAPHVIMNRTKDGVDLNEFNEEEDFVMVDGEKIVKPFVEKPVDGDDHNIYIYYPYSMGGGCKRLFRKRADRSADFSPDINHVRRDKSYIYEAFLPTGGTDVKVYTVGSGYAHAEARKSPTVDGRVQRSSDGKELRYPVLLTPEEKEIARKISIAFGQAVCGFDLLRCQEKSYVCDVNGWSFVKNSKKYYDDTSDLLRTLILSELSPSRLRRQLHNVPSGRSGDYDEALSLTRSASALSLQDQEVDGSSADELRCVLAVIRHGDRTPKQKLKVKVSQPELLELQMKYMDSKGKQAKLKTPNQLEELLEAVSEILSRAEYSGFVGTPPIHKYLDSSTSEDEQEYVEEKLETLNKFSVIKAVLERSTTGGVGGRFSGVNRKAQFKPLQTSVVDGQEKVTLSLLILKWGGVLTHAGREQAENLGKDFRINMYPSDGYEEGRGLLRLHSTYRHDLKIYSSDEGRVQMSAAAFCKGLLDLEGASLAPIIAAMVKKDTPMLDAFGKGASEYIQHAKECIHDAMTNEENCVLLSSSSLHDAAARENTTIPDCPPPAMRVDLYTEGLDEDDSPRMTSCIPTGFGNDTWDGQRLEKDKSTLQFSESQEMLAGGMHDMPERPVELLQMLKGHIATLVKQLEKKFEHEAMTEGADGHFQDWVRGTMTGVVQHSTEGPCNNEGYMLMYDRWKKLQSDFYHTRKNVFNISKIADIYDMIKYDAIHNGDLDLQGMEEIYTVSKAAADLVIPNEYGVGVSGKMAIGSNICSSLLNKLLTDLSNTREESFTAAGFSMAEGDESSNPSQDTVGKKESRNEGDEELDDHEVDDGMRTRLDPRFASEINTPERRVKTRLYFTSESHVHSLLNMLIYCDFCVGEDGEAQPVSKDARRELALINELDYLTQIVFRLFERKDVSLEDPKRFYIEVLFSPGASYNPLEVVPLNRNHCLPIRPCIPLHLNTEVEGTLTIELLEQLLRPHIQNSKDRSKGSVSRNVSACPLSP
eukprot:scaffold1501_cov352-Pavlova_lutheri.AAC.21